LYRLQINWGYIKKKLLHILTVSCPLSLLPTGYTIMFLRWVKRADCDTVHMAQVTNEKYVHYKPLFSKGLYIYDIYFIFYLREIFFCRKIS
jgi:hypothetical protein